MRSLFILVTFLSLCFVSTHAVAEPEIADPKSKHSYVAFESTGDIALTIAGRFSKPASIKGALPVVIIVHGSGGVDERGLTYSEIFNENGMATLEIDMWAARGLDGGLSRPAHVRDTLPDIYAAISYLKSRKDIDPKRIGLIGFSWGGVVAMLMSGQTESSDLKALVANYPVCWAYNKVPGYSFNHIDKHKRLMIISGEDDKYDGPDDCNNLVRGLPSESLKNVRLEVLSNATHAFELTRPDSFFFDPYAFQGKGGNVPLSYNDKATKKATNMSAQFFSEIL